MITKAADLRSALEGGGIVQRLVALTTKDTELVITATGERVHARSLHHCVSEGSAEPIAADLFGDELSAWRAPSRA